jgi:hypothetical protein
MIIVPVIDVVRADVATASPDFWVIVPPEIVSAPLVSVAVTVPTMVESVMVIADPVAVLLFAE